MVLTPLHDMRMVDAIVSLRRRGNDVAVLRLVAPDPADLPAVALAPTALRLWRLELDERVRSLNGIGVPVATWDAAAGLDEALLGLSAARRRQRPR